MAENRFNLIDEPWIPIVDVGRVSLRQLFCNPEYRALGGNPVQKIALTKLLLAIAQSAYTPADDAAWASLQPSGLAEKCLTYLGKWHDRFYLFGDKPFLQMSAIKVATIQAFGAVLPEVSTGNTTVMTQSQIERPMGDADKALLIVQLMGFGLGGKFFVYFLVLTAGYHGELNDKGKPSTGKPGTSLGFLGFLHNFLQGNSLVQTLWLNVVTQEQVNMLNIYTRGMGTAPWEQMPTGEQCTVANDLTNSLMGRLLPLSRFCLLTETGLHYSEGIDHQDYKSGGIDPSISVDFSSNPSMAIWVDPENRPWRVLTALLGFLSQSRVNKFDCHQLRFCVPRALHSMPTIGIWSGGLKVSSNAGEQYASGSDDFVESLLQLDTSILGELWFTNLQLEMDELDKLSKITYSSTLAYFKSQNMENKNQAAQAGNLFWQLCERQFQKLVMACESAELARALRPIFAGFVNKAYDTYCPKATARQLEVWAKNRPNLGKYLSNPNMKEAA